MLVKTFLDKLNPLDNVTIYAETVVGAEHLYSGTVYGIEKGLRENWDDRIVVGLWQWGGSCNIVIADTENVIKVPKRVYRAVKNAQEYIAKNEKCKTY